jgi:signal transduction histidine kinase
MATVALDVRVVLRTSGDVGEQVLQILLEGLRNTLRHGRARSAVLEASVNEGTVHIRLEDDGVGLEPLAPAPWSIASRVADLGGSLAIDPERGHGARLVISLPGGKS